MYVFNATQFACFYTNSCSYSSEYQAYGSSITGTVPLTYGVYLFIIYNENNYAVSFSLSTNTTYTQVS
ncbi:MAG: hypothetical protein RXR39_04280 [Caldivirga sp.]